MKKIIFYAAVVSIGFTSCVSKKKFLESETGRMNALDQAALLNKELENRRNDIRSLENNLRNLERDTARMGTQIRDYQIRLDTKKSEQEKLNDLLNQKMSQLDESQKTINQMQEMIKAQNEKVQQILGSVKNALLGFNSDELTVREQNGKIYVAMSDKLLFQSGSAKLDTRGKEALSKLAEVLNKQTDIDISIEGHTDNKPIHTARFADNWDLSVIRATSVVRILTQEYGVNPQQILPCGRGDLMPVADNETADGRSKNRRTEIIISPKLDELLKILQ